MSKLHRRILGQAQNHAASMGSYHPYGTGETPMTMPMHLTRYTGGGAYFEELTAVTPGAPAPERAATGHVPASTGGTWGNVYQAGRQ